MAKIYIMLMENGNTLGLTAKNDKDAKKLALTFLKFKGLKNEEGKTILYNVGCRII